MRSFILFVLSLVGSLILFELGADMFQVIVAIWLMVMIAWLVVLSENIKTINERAILNLIPAVKIEKKDQSFYMFTQTGDRFVMQGDSVENLISRIWSEMNISAALVFYEEKLLVSYFGRYIDASEYAE